MQKKIFPFLRNNPVFILMLPVFFVLHGYNENFGLVGTGDIMLLIVIYSMAAFVIYLLCLLVLHHRLKAGVLACYLLFFFFFYGAVQDFLKTHFFIASRYKVLIPLFSGLFFLLFFYLLKTKNGLNRLVFFINTLLIIYLFIDLEGISQQLIQPPVNKLAVYSNMKFADHLNSTAEKPDIYLLVFDEYAGSGALKEAYNFSNDLDPYLESKGFHIQKNAGSNYHYTWLSMASLLNMAYLEGKKPNQAVTREDIGYSIELIKNNEVIKMLSADGYMIANFSVFDLAGNPSPVKQELLPIKTRLITAGTFFSRLYRDFGWVLLKIDFIVNYTFYWTSDNNQRLLSITKDFSATKRDLPVFVYCHFYMPHSPHFYDKYGKLRDKKSIDEETMKKGADPKAYLEYLQYANTRIKGLVDTIQANTGGKAVIMVMGDHGFREKIDSNVRQNFQPMNAVYLPGGNYGQFYDSITCVNQFRVLFNTLFKESMPLLKDSSIFLRRINIADPIE